MKIAYLIDSSSMIDDVQEFCRVEGNFFMPIHIMIDEYDFLEGVNLDRNKVISLIESGSLPTTSLPSPLEMEDILTKIVDAGYDTLVCSLLGSGLSATQETFLSTARNFDLKVYNLDSKGAGLIQIHAIDLFKKYLNDGMDINEVSNKVQEMLDNSRALTVVDDLSHLKRGGRITSSAALIGGMLKIKPILECQKDLNGKLDVIEKVRTLKKAYIQMCDVTLKDIDISKYHICIAHYESLENAKVLEEIVKEYVNADTKIIVHDLSAVIGAHTGIGAVALFLNRNE